MVKSPAIPRASKRFKFSSSKKYFPGLLTSPNIEKLQFKTLTSTEIDVKYFGQLIFESIFLKNRRLNLLYGFDQFEENQNYHTRQRYNLQKLMTLCFYC